MIVLKKKNPHRILTTRGLLCEDGKGDGVSHLAGRRSTGDRGPEILRTADRAADLGDARWTFSGGWLPRVGVGILLLLLLLRHTPTEVGNACAESPDRSPYIVCSEEGGAKSQRAPRACGGGGGAWAGARGDGWGVQPALRWPAARGSMGPGGGCMNPMLNWPSWEERRKGGEGRSRPRQAKNAIILVVGAGRPLCLDGKGSGDTQDEPRDQWHVLTDRLVVCARHWRFGGPQAAASPSPTRVPGYQGVPRGCEPLSLHDAPTAPLSRGTPKPTSWHRWVPPQA